MPLSHKCRPPCLNIWARCAETWNSSTGNLCRAEDTKKLFLPVALQGNKRAFPLRLGVSYDPSYPSSFSRVYSQGVSLYPCRKQCHASPRTSSWHEFKMSSRSSHHHITGKIVSTEVLRINPCQGILPETALGFISRNQFPKADSPFPNLATIYLAFKYH